MTDQPLSLSQLAARKEARKAAWDKFQRSIFGMISLAHPSPTERQAEADIDSYVQIIAKLVTAFKAIDIEYIAILNGKDSWSELTEAVRKGRTLLKELGEKT